MFYITAGRDFLGRCGMIGKNLYSRHNGFKDYP